MKRVKTTAVGAAVSYLHRAQHYWVNEAQISVERTWLAWISSYWFNYWQEYENTFSVRKLNKPKEKKKVLIIPTAIFQEILDVPALTLHF